MNILQTIWEDVKQGENIDLYVTIIIAVLLPILSLMNLAPTTWIPSITLTVLALLAITNLVNRHKLDKVIENQTPTQFFFEEYPEEDLNDIKNAKELWLVGYHLSATIVKLSTVIEEKLSRKEKITVLLMDPNSQACQYANASLLYPTTDEQFRDRIRISLTTLRSIAQKYPDFLKVYLVDQLMPFGAHAMNIDDSNGKMYIQLYSYKSGGNDPRIVLNKKDGRWYDLYQGQLKALLKKATLYKF